MVVGQDNLPLAIDLSMKAAILSGLNDFVSDSIFNFPRVPTFAQH